MILSAPFGGGHRRGEGEAVSEFPCVACRIGRRTALGLGWGLALGPRLVLAQAEPARERPKEGDLLVAAKAGTSVEPIKPEDVPLGTKQVFAWPMDPASETVRNGSRLNKLLLLRL